MQLFDTHAHLDDPQFDGTRDAVVERARQSGVVGVVSVGTTADSSQATIELADRYDLVWAAVGIQPNYCSQAETADWQRVEQLAHHPRVVALGETGLDRYWDHSRFEIQQEYFDRHVRLSQQMGLPFIVHLRDCEPDILELLRCARQRGPFTGVMHSFTGSLEGAAEFVQLGLYISFAGMITYKKSDDLRSIAATIPADRLLIETDAPYLAPHPKRGQRPNEPALVRHTLECLAGVRGVSAEQLADQTTRNAKRLFRLD